MKKNKSRLQLNTLTVRSFAVLSNAQLKDVNGGIAPAYTKADSINTQFTQIDGCCSCAVEV